MIGRWNGENSVIIRYEQEQRRLAEAEARDRAALEDFDDGNIPEKSEIHKAAIIKIKLENES